MSFGFIDSAKDAIPLHLAGKANLEQALAALSPRDRTVAQSVGFQGEPGAVLPITDAEGKLSAVVVGVGGPMVSANERDLWSLASLPTGLPPGSYKLASEPAAEAATLMALGWALGAYAFEEFKPRGKPIASLVWPANADRARVTREAEAATLGRDLINRPASHLGCEALTAAALDLAKRHGAKAKVITGKDLLTQNYPMIYHVGRAAVEEPRLVDFTWGDETHPRVTLVGKGVIFDTGGLDLKPPASMKIMKKDMGGAASVMALAHMIMAAKLPVRLRVMLPIVENAIAADAFRPLDVLPSRKGITVEIGNTDAEGRLILADALTEADSEKPQLLVNVCTLTGNARVALGPELPSVFTRHDDVADVLYRQSVERADPLWRMPLWPHYRKQIDSRIAHINNVSESAFAGAIIAGLFLAEFVSAETPWVHVDLSGWNFGNRPGRPEGGEVLAMRAMYGTIEAMFKGGK